MSNEFEQYSEMLLPGVSDWFKDNNDTTTKGVITDAKPDWPEKDIKALSEFCKKYKILGFNCGNMSPVAAIALLKRKLGIMDNPLSERVPFGDKKSINNPEYPYLTMVHKKNVLHG